jgi:multiple sugar transport system substrate-binding protein
MRHRHHLAVLLVVLVLLSACGFDGSVPEVTIDPAATPDSAGAATALPEATLAPGETVTLSFGAQEFERQAYESLIETFNQQNPGIQVQFVSLDEATRPQPGEAFDPGAMVRRIVSAADTASVFFIRAEDMRNGLLYDLKPLIDADPEFDAGDFYPGVFDAASLGGATYMLPRTIQVQLLSYNKDLWAARGLPPPKPDWAWNDLIGAAEQLARKRGSEVDVYGLLDWGGGFTTLLNEVAAAGVDLFSTPVDQLHLDQPGIEAALDHMAKLADSGAIYARPQDPNLLVSNDDFRKLIVEGRAAIWPREMLFSGPENDKPAFAIGTVPYPQTDLPFFANMQGYVMSSGTQHPQAAWRWLAFLSRQKLDTPFQGPDDLGSLPARKSLAESSGYWSKLDSETVAAVQAAIAHPAAPLPANVFDNRFIEPLSKALNAVLGGTKPAQALREAQTALDEQIAQAQTTPSPALERGPVVVATPVVERVPEGATLVTFGAMSFGGDQIRRVAREFNQNSPEVFVQIKNIEPSDGMFRLDNFAKQADCFQWFGPPDQGEVTATLDLQPLIDADATFDIADYPATLLAPFRRGSGLYGLPHEVNFRVLTYNKQAFDAAGLSYPSAEWTMDDLLNAAQKLTIDGSEKDKQYGYASLGSVAQDLFFFLDRFGARITTGSGETQQPNFTDPKVAQAARFYVELLLDYSPHPELEGYKRNSSFGGQIFELTNSGRIGMWLGEGGAFIFSSGPEAQKFTRAIAPPPLGQGPLAPEDFRSSGLFISAQTKQAQACWQWLKFLSSSPAALSPQNGFPARSSVAESEAYLKGAPEGAAEVYKAYRAAFDRSSSADRVRQPYYQSQLDFFWFFRAVDRAMQGKDLDRELADAQELTEQYMACLRDNPGIADCASQVDPTYEGWNSSG